MSPRDLVLGAIDRMIQSCEEEIGENDPGNHATIGALRGEMKGLMAARAYAANAIPPEGTDRNAVIEQCAAIPDLWVNAPSCSPDGTACEHKRTAHEIARRIRALKISEPQSRIEGGKDGR